MFSTADSLFGFILGWSDRPGAFYGSGCDVQDSFVLRSSARVYYLADGSTIHGRCHTCVIV